jgi:hypothetical protein
MRSTKSIILPVSEAVLWRNKTVTIGRASEREKGIKECTRKSAQSPGSSMGGWGSRRMTTGAGSKGLPAAVGGKKMTMATVLSVDFRGEEAE